MGLYAEWMIEHPKKSAGLELGTAIAHVAGAQYAAAFEKVTRRTHEGMIFLLKKYWRQCLLERPAHWHRLDLMTRQM
jgi:hypothetical protein